MIKLINLLELNVNNPNITPQELSNYYQNHFVWHEYQDIVEPIFQKVQEWDPSVADEISISHWFRTISKKSLNFIYKELKQVIQNQNINELSVTKPSRTYDLREENWPNLSSAIFDKIEIGDRIIDPEFIGIVYEIEFDDMLDDYIMAYKDDNGGDKFIDREWFDSVSKED